MAERETILQKDYKPRRIQPEDSSYGDIVMQLSDQPVKPKYWFEDFGDYWSCSCGQINRKDTCSNCGLERELLRRLFQNDMIDASDTEGEDVVGSVPDRADTAAEGHDDLPQTSDTCDTEDNDSIDEGDERQSLEYIRRKRRTRVILIVLMSLIALLGGGLAAFYFYVLPEMDRQENIQIDAAKDSLANELPDTVKPLGETEFDIDRNLGDHYYDKKNYEKAIDYYTKALKIQEDDSLRHKINAAKFSYVSSHQEEGGAVFEDYLEDLYKAKYTGIQDIYNRYYTWKASTVTNTSSADYSTDMSTIDRVNTIYFHTTFSGGPPKDSLDLYYEIVWPDGTSERKAVAGNKESGETLTTNCQYTFPARPDEGRLTYKLFNNTTSKQISSDSVTLR